MKPEELYMRLGTLLQTMPDLTIAGPPPAKTKMWLAEAYALVQATGEVADTVAIKPYVDGLLRGSMSYPADVFLEKVEPALYRAFKVAELRAPAQARGAFIPAGNVFDALIAVSGVLGSAKNGVLIVDPYMDEKALSDFAILAPDGVQVRLLADTADKKPTLGPAVNRWKAQYASRPLEARLAPAKALHDRMLDVDGAAMWISTQSFNAMAARSPAVLVRVDEETAKLKRQAYEAMWLTATPI